MRDPPCRSRLSSVGRACTWSWPVSVRRRTDGSTQTVRLCGDPAELGGRHRRRVKKLGGRPAEAKTQYGFPVDKLKTQEDVLRFAAGLEKGAVPAYLGAVPLFEDRAIAQVAASILGEEGVH